MWKNGLSDENLYNIQYTTLKISNMNHNFKIFEMATCIWK